MMRSSASSNRAWTGPLRSVPNPGRSSVHRLNRAEYANAIRDLLALEVDAAALLPPDDSADGFDNIADVLSLSPALLESYLSAAAKISALAVGSPKITANSETYKVRGDMAQTEHLEGMPLGTRGGVSARHTFPLDGEYVIRVKLVETNLGTIRGLQDENQLEITVGGQRVLLAPVGGHRGLSWSRATTRPTSSTRSTRACRRASPFERDSGWSPRASLSRRPRLGRSGCRIFCTARSLRPITSVFRISST